MQWRSVLRVNEGRLLEMARKGLRRPTQSVVAIRTRRLPKIWRRSGRTKEVSDGKGGILDQARADANDKDTGKQQMLQVEQKQADRMRCKRSDEGDRRQREINQTVRRQGMSESDHQIRGRMTTRRR
ncbi:hypothetical protein BDW69DRAFT_117662 [Aspergillus filifer]